MKLDKLVGERFKEKPSDCVVESHALMMRGGYMRQLCNGIYSLYPPARRITRKIEQFIREEMDAIGGQEVLFPVVMPASLWRESGRYESIGSEMPEALPDKEATLLVYCRSGRRSKDAAQKLLALGYQSVYDFGGVIDWPYELVKEG